MILRCSACRRWRWCAIALDARRVGAFVCARCVADACGSVRPAAWLRWVELGAAVAVVAVWAVVLWTIGAVEGLP